MKEILKEIKKEYSNVSIITDRKKIDSFIIRNYSQIRDYGKNPEYGKTIGLICFELLSNNKEDDLEVFIEKQYEEAKKHLTKAQPEIEFTAECEKAVRAWSKSLSEALYKTGQEHNIRYIIDIRELKEKKTFFLLEKVFWDFQYFVEHIHSNNIEDIYKYLSKRRENENFLEAYHG